MAITSFEPDPAVKKEFELLKAVLQNILTACERAEKKYCEGVPKSDPEVNGLYQEMNSGLNHASLFDDHIASHHPG